MRQTRVDARSKTGSGQIFVLSCSFKVCFILLFVGFCLALQFLLLAYVFVCIHHLYFWIMTKKSIVNARHMSVVCWISQGSLVIPFVFFGRSRSHCGIKGAWNRSHCSLHSKCFASTGLLVEATVVNAAIYSAEHRSLPQKCPTVEALRSANLIKPKSQSTQSMINQKK